MGCLLSPNNISKRRAPHMWSCSYAQWAWSDRVGVRRPKSWVNSAGSTRHICNMRPGTVRTFRGLLSSRPVALSHPGSRVPGQKLCPCGLLRHAVAWTSPSRPHVKETTAGETLSRYLRHMWYKRWWSSSWSNELPWSSDAPRTRVEFHPPRLVRHNQSEQHGVTSCG